MVHVSDIKLIRTDTTLDLSQKAEKGMLCSDLNFPFYTQLSSLLHLILPMWDSKLTPLLAFFCEHYILVFVAYDCICNVVQMEQHIAAAYLLYAAAFQLCKLQV
ncbi:hypothetical protein JRO89_XS15G0013700 [Xanthoceras sorbifolium]|uniref:Uncharacterized protein n=1 Tax=Xanthoceras sorbifolium TaxID=99658 RepID=A0ABQ8H0P5_9ROSI|nr:hypothetical protein JRO89_XS15G0013700 [Xanthoceras sorbifolium]